MEFAAYKQVFIKSLHLAITLQGRDWNTPTRNTRDHPREPWAGQAARPSWRQKMDLEQIWGLEAVAPAQATWVRAPSAFQVSGPTPVYLLSESIPSIMATKSACSSVHGVWSLQNIYWMNWLKHICSYRGKKHKTFSYDRVTGTGLDLLLQTTGQKIHETTVFRHRITSSSGLWFLERRKTREIIPPIALNFYLETLSEIRKWEPKLSVVILCGWGDIDWRSVRQLRICGAVNERSRKRKRGKRKFIALNTGIRSKVQYWWTRLLPQEARKRTNLNKNYK